jgi:Flp pilus assembly protein TadG
MYHGYVPDVMPVRITKGDEVMKINSSEKGQALIVIAFAAIVLFSFAALAIDGSMVFSDKRHAQNAADTAVLAAALAKVRGQSFDNAAINRATTNGYNNNGTTNTVVVYNPPTDGNYAGNNEYIQVKITSHVNTVFARIIGVSEMVNKAEAVARTGPSIIASMYDGNALVALNKTACSAVNYQGGATSPLMAVEFSQTPTVATLQTERLIRTQDPVL